MTNQEEVILKWNNFKSNVGAVFKHLRNEFSFRDVTLACEGQTCKGHRMVLAIYSPILASMLENDPLDHPILLLKDVPFNHLQAILEFMYTGAVDVPEDELHEFLKTATKLEIKGLSDVKYM